MTPDEAVSTPVHLAGAIRPFALCHSFTAAERHTRYPEDVTCTACLEKMTAGEGRAGARESAGP